MKVRDTYLVKAQTLTDAGTVTIPILKGLKIQHLRVKIGATNGATSNTVGKLCGMVSKIEVVDGSDLLHSVSMREAQAINCFQNYFFPRKELSAGAAVAIFEEAIVNFGMGYKDRRLYLDTSRFSNPQLRITYALTISATAGFATGTGALSVIARIIEDQAPPYAGFVMAKEVDSWATATSGDHTTLLAFDWPYLALVVAALKTTVDPRTLLTNFKLQRDAGAFIDYDLTSEDVLSDNQAMFGPFEEKFRPLKDTTFTWLSDLYAKTGAWMDICGAVGKGSVTTAVGESIGGIFTTGEAVDLMDVNVRGLAPHASFYLPFGDGQTPEDALNPAGLKELKLIKSQAVGAAAGTVVALQIRQ
jgi:hypothetical protein